MTEVKMVLIVIHVRTLTLTNYVTHNTNKYPHRPNYHLPSMARFEKHTRMLQLYMMND